MADADSLLRRFITAGWIINRNLLSVTLNLNRAMKEMA